MKIKEVNQKIMRIIIMGAPGAGKGTQASVLSEKLNIPHISTGDIFRENIRNKTGLGLKAKNYIETGRLVPDEVTVEIIIDRLNNEDCGKGFILDGFPRTVVQAEHLERVLKAKDIKIDNVVNITVCDDEIIKRLSGRRICMNCGAVYHVTSNPSLRENVCNICSGKLVQREDDTKDTVLKRLRTYHEKTEPVTNYYNKKDILINVEGSRRIEETTMHLLEALGVD
mgnify:CR=1 FL=1